MDEEGGSADQAVSTTDCKSFLCDLYGTKFKKKRLLHRDKQQRHTETGRHLGQGGGLGELRPPFPSPGLAPAQELRLKLSFMRHDLPEPHLFHGKVHHKDHRQLNH